MNNIQAEQLALDIERTVCPVLFGDLETDDMLVVEYEMESRENWGDDPAIAYHTYLEDDYCDATGFKYRVHQIERLEDVQLDIERFKTMICHELVHIMQEFRGDNFDYSKKYTEQEHEIEAYDLEQYLVFYYNTKEHWKDEKDARHN